MKVIFAASSGGHYAQLLQLRPAMEKCESVIITEKTDSIRKEYVSSKTDEPSGMELFFLRTV